MVVYRNGLDWFRLHVDVPDLQRQIVSREDVPSIMTELDVRDRRDDFGEEGSVSGVLFFLEHCMTNGSVERIQRGKYTYSLRAGHKALNPACQPS